MAQYAFVRLTLGVFSAPCHKTHIITNAVLSGASSSLLPKVSVFKLCMGQFELQGSQCVILVGSVALTCLVLRKSLTLI